MPKFLASGKRRDIVILISGLDEPRGNEIKRALEDRYGERIAPREFHGALEALEDAGFVRRRVDGVHDRYSLSEAGAEALRDHVEWIIATVNFRDE